MKLDLKLERVRERAANASAQAHAIAVIVQHIVQHPEYAKELSHSVTLLAGALGHLTARIPDQE